MRLAVRTAPVTRGGKIAIRVSVLLRTNTREQTRTDFAFGPIADPPSSLDAVAHVDLGRCIRVSEQSRVVAAKLGKTGQPTGAGFENQIFVEVEAKCVYHARGLVV